MKHSDLEKALAVAGVVWLLAHVYAGAVDHDEPGKATGPHRLVTEITSDPTQDYWVDPGDHLPPAATFPSTPTTLPEADQ